MRPRNRSSLGVSLRRCSGFKLVGSCSRYEWPLCFKKLGKAQWTNDSAHMGMVWRKVSLWKKQLLRRGKGRQFLHLSHSPVIDVPRDRFIVLKPSGRSPTSPPGIPIHGRKDKPTNLLRHFELILLWKQAVSDKGYVKLIKPLLEPLKSSYTSLVADPSELSWLSVFNDH